MSTRTVLDGMPDRLQAAKDAVASARKALALALQQRNLLIVQAVDGGMSQGQVATNVGVGQPAVVKILARPNDLAIA